MRLRDVVPRRSFLEGKKVKIDDVLDQELTFTGWDIRPSKFKNGSGECLILQFRQEGRLFILTTGSTCLINDLKKFEEKQGKISFDAKIVKSDNAYIFM